LIPTGASARNDPAAMHTSFPENLAAQRRRSAAGVSPSDESICWAAFYIGDRLKNKVKCCLSIQAFFPGVYLE
jgi:hypothetical protein